MHPTYTFGIACTLLLTTSSALAQHDHNAPSDPSPYVDQRDSLVRGLSSQEVDDLLKGRGAGYARMAELNSYPGPRHVLDLKQELALSPQQEQEIQAVFKQMRLKAQRLGQTIVDREQEFSNAFAEQMISASELEQQTQELAKLYGELRQTHLQAHLQLTPLLSAEQIEKYNRFRGYTQTGSL